MKEKEALLERLKILEEAQEAKRQEEPQPAATEESMEKAHDRGAEQAETIGLTEQQTRKLLIDSLLKDAGWMLKPRHEAYDANTSQPQALPEYSVEHQPTNSGKGSMIMC